MGRKVKVSIIVPAYNEKDNIPALFEAFEKLRAKVDFPFELVLVDDGSTDGTADVARSLLKKFPFVKLVSYGANQGKTYAIMRGLEVSEGEYVVIFDADLQFDPEDIPPMIKKLDAGADVVAGYKVGKYQKPFVSKVYNLLGRILFKVPVKDMNAMKALRREVLELMPFRPDWHRYIVVWAHTHGYKILDHPVKLRPRRAGVSKYRGIGRVFIGFFDMLSVWFQLKFVRRPMLFFGTLGLLTFGLAFVIGVVALILRFGFNLGYRPLLTLVAMLANIGLLLFIGGFLGEVIEGIQERLRRIESRLRTLSPRFETGESSSQKDSSASRRKSRQGKNSRRNSRNKRPEVKGEERATPPEESRNSGEKAEGNGETSGGEAERQSASESVPDRLSEGQSSQEQMIWGRRIRKKH